MAKLTFIQRLKFAWIAFRHSKRIVYGLPVSFEYESDLGFFGTFINPKGEEIRKPLI